MIEILRKINIKKRLEIYFIIASVVPILLIGVTCSIINFNKMQQSAINYSNNITRQTKINIKSYFDSYINRLKSISSDKTLVNDLQAYNKSNWREKEAIENRIRISLASTFGGDSEIESVEVCTYENLRFYYTSPISYGNINGKNSSALLKKSQSNDITCNLLKKEVSYDDKLYTIISKQIKNESDEFVGVILLALNKEFIDKVCVENLSVNGSNLILLDESKNMISTSNDKLNESYYKEIISLISNSNDKKDRDIGSKVKVDNQDMVLSYEYYDTIGWTIINLIPYNYLMNNTIKLIIITCIIAIIIAFIAFKLSKIITKSIYDPINSLINAMNNTNIENRVKDDSEDEYGILIDGFNKMNTKINSTINDVYEHKLKESKLNAYKKEAELASLQKQINPHFLYNTIESIYWNGELSGNTELSDMILSLGDYLRSIINKGREHILVKSEIESVNNYIFLQNKRFEYGISCNWSLSNDINNMYILKLMIQPIIDDIVSFNMENSDSLIKIDIEIINKDKRLYFMINNDSVTYFLNNITIEDENINLGINRTITSIMNNENVIGFVSLYTESNNEFSYGKSFLKKSNIDEIKNNKAIYNNITWDTINYNNKEYIIAYKKIKLRYDKDDEVCLILSLNKEYINNLCLEILSNNNQSIVILDENNKVLIGSYENSEYTVKDKYIISDSIENTNYKILNIFRYDYSYYSKENVIIVALTVIIMVFSILLLLLLKSISKPLNELLHKMKRLEKEDIKDYEVVKDNTKSRDEQYILNEEFDKMVTRLKLLIKDIYESRIKEQEIQGRIKELELNALQQQINPHFLYNTLESMFWLAELNSQGEISEMISELGSFFKTSISGNSEYTLIKNEIENAISYISIQKIMFENDFDVIWDVDNEVLGYKTLKLILQPIIENCLIHGLSFKEDNGLIYISCKKFNDDIVFEINDNGCGISEEKCKEINDYINSKENDVKKSVGIKNVNQRIRLYYSEDYGVSIKSKLHIGTFVKIVIPIKG